MAQINPTLDAIQTWLKTCPLAFGQADGAIDFRICDLPGETTRFSLEEAGEELVLQSFFNGRRKARDYTLTSWESYSEPLPGETSGEGGRTDLARWVEDQSDARRLPALGPGLTPEQVAVTRSGFLPSCENGARRFQIQIRLVYFQQKGTL